MTQNTVKVRVVAADGQLVGRVVGFEVLAKEPRVVAADGQQVGRVVGSASSQPTASRARIARVQVGGRVTAPDEADQVDEL